ncbi:MAG: VWA domain-containing protein, partial [Bdellovibrionales bacterium]|nr:VWA domain-containing protein [Bdellovibrionales bacterium]
IVIVGVALFAILAIFFFAVDVATIHRAKLRLQRALDASTVAATYLFESKDENGNFLLDDELNQVAEQIITDNLVATGVRPEQILEIKASFLPVNRGNPALIPARVVELSANIAPAGLLLPHIPWIHQAFDISGSAQGQNRKVAISLIADTSGSMDDVMDCHGQPGSCLKIDELRKAVRAFVEQFANEADHRLAFITFNDDVAVPQPMVRNPDLSPDSALTYAIGRLDDNHTQGYTNTWTAMQEAVEQLRSPINNDLMPHDMRAIVLVTDGSPRGRNGFYNFAPEPPDVGPDCEDFLEATYPGSDWGNDIERRNIMLRRAMKRYLGALQQSDIARNDDFVVFAVGIGNVGIRDVNADCAEDDTEDELRYNPNDPYQCTTNDLFAKNFFLARLAKDLSWMQGDPNASPPVPPDPDFPVECVPDKEQIPGKQGNFYLTSDPSELTPLLLNVAKNIKARISQ